MPLQCYYARPVCNVYGRHLPALRNGGIAITRGPQNQVFHPALTRCTNFGEIWQNSCTDVGVRPQKLKILQNFGI